MSWLLWSMKGLMSWARVWSGNCFSCVDWTEVGEWGWDWGVWGRVEGVCDRVGGEWGRVEGVWDRVGGRLPHSSDSWSVG